MGLRSFLTMVLFSLGTFVLPESSRGLHQPKPDDVTFLRFKKVDRVEVVKSRGLIDLDKSYTIEAWVRWNESNLKWVYLAGDEAWKDMSGEVPVTHSSGWVLRVSSVEGADKRRIDFTVAVAKGKAEWLTLLSPPRRCPDDQRWHHVAVCKTAQSISVYWNGILAAQKPCVGIEFSATPTNFFLGVRKHSAADTPPERQFDGDFRAFRVSDKPLYFGKFKPPEVFKRDDSTLVLLDFSKGEGKQLEDISEKGHDGLIVGPKWVKPAP